MLLSASLLLGVLLGARALKRDIIRASLFSAFRELILAWLSLLAIIVAYILVNEV